MSNNNVKDWGEFQKLAELSSLEDLLFVGESQRMGIILCALDNTHGIMIVLIWQYT